MPATEEIRVLIFIAFVGTVYLLAAIVLTRSLLSRFGLVRQPAGRFSVYFRRIILLLALAGVVCFAYGYFIEPYWPEITQVTIRSPKFAETGRPLRIVHISDLHSDAHPRLEGRLPKLIDEQKPDLIFFTGDAANSPEGIPTFRSFISEVARIAPTYVVKGNWDVGLPAALDPFAGTGVVELKGEAVKVEVGGRVVWITGVGFDGVGQIRHSIESVPAEAFSIFLYHYPDEIYQVAESNIDLYCSGHTHGGQVALPIYGALITLSRYGKRFEAGLYQVGKTQLYVNRGIGMEGGIAPRVRFWARPEITVYEISR